MDREKVLKLAGLARIRIPEEEAESLSREFAAILNYVGEVKSAAAISTVKSVADFPVRNIMRDDAEGHEPGMNTEKLLALAPLREGSYFKVKKIL